ncbi:MAG TPA: hypothetical protein VM282_25460 [Acidimicrobiales bacterium]|nr:hypothetical protein [Acidimicrobiales bacterium]
MPARELFLHEFIDIIGQGQWAYMEHAKAQAGHEKVDFELLGTWYTMGITGRWPQVINIWEIPGGWDGWYGKVDRLGLKRRTNADLFKWWDTAYKLRTGGFDRLLGGHPGCPNIAQLTRESVKGTLFVHEITTVKPGTATEYLDATREVRQPLMNEYGHRLVGLYEVLMHDYEVCTVWATDAVDHVRMGKAFDVARGLLDADSAGVAGDSRIVEWRRAAQQWTAQFREELMTPAPGTICGPTEYETDDSVIEQRSKKTPTKKSAASKTKTATKKTATKRTATKTKTPPKSKGKGKAATKKSPASKKRR